MSKKYTYDEVKEYIENEGYQLISNEYRNNKDKLSMKCPKGHNVEMNFHDFKSAGHRCAKCARREKDASEVSEYLNSFGYELIGEYKNTNSKTLIKCPKGHIIDMPIGRFNSGHRCRICQHGQKHTDEEVKGFFEEYGYKVVGKYKRRDVKIDLICPSGHDIKISLDCFKKGVRCCKCNGSNGEKEIVSFLDKNNIEYETQYIFNDCRDKQPLPFDFYIPNQNIAIEYDGKQHYKPISVYGGEKAFEICQIHDEIKNKYCEENDIKLIRIPYWDFDNIEQILRDEQIIS